MSKHKMVSPVQFECLRWAVSHGSVAANRFETSTIKSLIRRGYLADGISDYAITDLGREAWAQWN